MDALLETSNVAVFLTLRKCVIHNSLGVSHQRQGTYRDPVVDPVEIRQHRLIMQIYDACN